MFTKFVKSSLFIGLGVLLLAVLLFGSSAGSFISSSFRQVQTKVADNVPLEFELQRAKDMLEQIIPEMTANIQLISQEEVEIASLKTQINENIKPLAMERNQIQALTGQVQLQNASYELGGHQFTQQELTSELANRFERFRQAEMLQNSRVRMLETREKSLKNAIAVLASTKENKALLENKIAALESQYRLIQASSVGTSYSINNSSLAKTEKLISQIKKRLDVAERVLANNGKFLNENIDNSQNVIDTADLVGQINDYMNPQQPAVLPIDSGHQDGDLQNAVAR
ncbi:MAG: hypothetical protein JXM68_14820 [Sedimentisphaerales bacterium]|nr:hypothetical protein [Sedimentisphaerales bacterium]